MRYTLGFILGFATSTGLIFGSLYVLFILPFVEWH